MGLYTLEPDLCDGYGHCCRFGYRSSKCKSAPRCRSREPQTLSTSYCTAPPVWFSGPPNLYSTILGRMAPRSGPTSTLCLYQPSNQPAAFPPLPSAGAAAISLGRLNLPYLKQHGHLSLCHPELPNYASVVGAAGSPRVPATFQDVVQLLLEIQAGVRNLNVRVTACLRATTQPVLRPSLPRESVPECAGQPAAPASVCPGPASLQPVSENQPRIVSASPRPQPGSVPVQPLPQYAPDSHPRSVPPSLGLPYMNYKKSENLH
ncbi:hypothetical protein E2C01_023212 [Portunus trituberculatus]|uniref:Uncharacterized protein n=1 Tax=Portunus trituberculatus TaxID=210409 RepID=A0A5B7E877_PORTR|nr:hypothetical protein [Portunus trituberculatus]